MALRSIRRTSAVVGIVGMTALGAVNLAPAASAQGAGEEVGPFASVGTESKIPDVLQPGENTLLVSGGYGACFQWARLTLDPGGYPGSTMMNPEANSIGLGDCTQDITVHWKNLDSGNEDARVWTAEGPGWVKGPVHPYDSILGTGTGTVEIWATAEKSGASSDTVTVEVPEYQP